MLFNFKKALRSQSAETLAEVIIALTVVSVAGAAVAKMVIMSVGSTQEGEERLIAYNLAREGVELIRNFRDTNWLRFPSDHEECWNTISATNSNECPESIKLSGDEKRYTVGLEVEDEEKLLSLRIDEENGTDRDQDDLLYAVEVDQAGSIIYTHLDPDSPLLAVSNPTIYYRIIKVTACAADVLCITSIVMWEGQGEEKQIVFTDQLQNY